MKHPGNWVKSFCYAFQGFGFALAERNFRFHLITASVVIISSCMLPVSLTEWALIVSAISLVLIMEIVNTVIETLCDWISIRPLRVIKKIKDMSAAAVLLSAVYAAIIGCIIFIPKLYPSILKLLQP